MTKRRPHAPPPQTTILAVVSDLHCGSTVALCPPRISLDDGGHYEASRAQRWLWDCWQAFWERVARVRDAQGARLVVVVNGDITDGNHHNTTQILSGNPTAQAAVVNEVLSVPLALAPEALAFIRGTEAHAGPSAAYEERIAIGLKRDGRPVILDADTGNASWWALTMDIQGVRVHFAHHGKIGTRPSTKMTTVYAQAFDIWTEHHLRGEDPPAIALRSHMHRYADSYNAYPTRLIQTPAWQLATAYAHRIAPNTLADIGGVLITISNGVAAVEEHLYRPASLTTWRPSP